MSFWKTFLKKFYRDKKEAPIAKVSVEKTEQSITKIPTEKIEQSLFLAENKIVVLVDAFDELFSGDSEEMARNVFLIDKKGNVLWRISADPDFGDQVKTTYVSISYDDKKLKAIGWNTILYKVDEETGAITAEMLLK